MENEYDNITATHYSSFRPSLHQPILSRCIERKKKYASGLDIGCGTGQSSIALIDYCDNVIGIEPSSDMVKLAIQHPQIKYVHHKGENLSFEDNSFELITFAGSLYYAKSQKILDEVIRVSDRFAKIIVYDFEIQLDEILTKLDVSISDRSSETKYNHQESFSGLTEDCIEQVKRVNEKLFVQIDSSDLSHLILSSKDNYLLLNKKYDNRGIYHKTVNNLKQISNGEKHNLQANVYYAVYQCSKPIGAINIKSPR